MNVTLRCYVLICSPVLASQLLSDLTLDLKQTSHPRYWLLLGYVTGESMMVLPDLTSDLPVCV